jgi:hypothetical protein
MQVSTCAQANAPRSSPDDRLDSSTLFRIKPDELSGSGSYPSNPRAAEGLEYQFPARKAQKPEYVSHFKLRTRYFNNLP